MAAEAAQRAATAAGDARPQVQQKAADGGDKYRLTQFLFWSIHDMFRPGVKPHGQLGGAKGPKPVLLVPCKWHCKSSDIDFVKKVWTRDHEIRIGDQTITRKAGASTNGCLNGWLQYLVDHPEDEFITQYEIWGQPAAWQDTQISIWLVEHISRAFKYSMPIVDALGAQWAEDTLLQCWACQAFQQAIGPWITDKSAIPDTLLHFLYKSYLGEAKAEMQEQCEAASRQVGEAFSPKLNPGLILRCCGKAYKKLQCKLNEFDYILHEGIKNQLIVTRPGPCTEPIPSIPSTIEAAVVAPAVDGASRGGGGDDQLTPEQKATSAANRAAAIARRVHSGQYGFCFPCGLTRALEGANGACVHCKARLLTAEDSDVEFEPAPEVPTCPEPVAAKPPSPAASPAEAAIDQTAAHKYINKHIYIPNIQFCIYVYIYMYIYIIE